MSSNVTDGNAGNDSDTVMADIGFDTEGPVVAAVETVNGALAACDDLRQPVSTISVSIEDEASPVVGADNAANYLLVGSGPDSDSATAGCGGVAGDDEAVTIAGVVVDDTDPQRSSRA